MLNWIIQTNMSHCEFVTKQLVLLPPPLLPKAGDESHGMMRETIGREREGGGGGSKREQAKGIDTTSHNNRFHYYYYQYSDSDYYFFHRNKSFFGFATQWQYYCIQRKVEGKKLSTTSILTRSFPFSFCLSFGTRLAELMHSVAKSSNIFGWVGLEIERHAYFVQKNECHLSQFAKYDQSVYISVLVHLLTYSRKSFSQFHYENVLPTRHKNFSFLQQNF